MHLTGLAWAKSPIFVLGRARVCLVALNVRHQDEFFDVPVFVDAALYSRMPLNELVRLGDCALFNFTLGAGKRGVGIKFKDASALETITEEQVESCPTSVLQCRKQGVAFELVSYTGVVTLPGNGWVILDETVMVSGTALAAKVGDSLQFFNLLRPDEGFGGGPPHAGTRLISCPAFTSCFLNGTEAVAVDPPVRPVHDYAAVERMVASTLGPDHASRVAAVLSAAVPAKSIPVLFLDILDGEVAFLQTPRFALGADLVGAGAMDPGSTVQVHQTECQDCLVGVIRCCGATGFFLFQDRSSDRMRILASPDMVGRLVCIKRYRVVSEVHAVDPMVSRVGRRVYILPLETVFVDPAAEPAYYVDGPSNYLIAVQDVVYPQLARMSPPRLQGSVRGSIVVTIGRPSGGQYRLKAIDGKDVELELGAEFLALHPRLEPGCFVWARRDAAGALVMHALIESVELADALSKGDSILDGTAMLMSSTAYRHTMKRVVPRSLTGNVRGVISGAADLGLVSCRGVVKALALLVAQESAYDRSFLQLFEQHGIGLAHSESRLVLTVGDVDDPSFEVEIVLPVARTSILPLGLLPGALVEGRNLLPQDGRLVLGAGSILRVLDPSPDPVASSARPESGALPFHYLADFACYPVRHPQKAVLIRCRLLEVTGVALVALCRKCQSPVERGCCPIHSRLEPAESVLAGEMTCLVTDSTFDAEVVTTEPPVMLALLQLEGSLAEIHAAVAWSGRCAGGPAAAPPPLRARLESLDRARLARVAVKGICTQAIPRVQGADQMVVRKYRLGRQYAQAYCRPGKVVIRAVHAAVLGDRSSALHHLGLLGM